MEGINANDKIYKMSFSKVYPLLVTKCEKKGRTREEVDQVTCWLTGYVLEIFKSQLSAFTIRKNAVYLPYEKELPIKIIEKIIKQSLEEIT